MLQQLNQSSRRFIACSPSTFRRIRSPLWRIRIIKRRNRCPFHQSNVNPERIHGWGAFTNDDVDKYTQRTLQVIGFLNQKTTDLAFYLPQRAEKKGRKEEKPETCLIAQEIAHDDDGHDEHDDVEDFKVEIHALV